VADMPNVEQLNVWVRVAEKTGSDAKRNGETEQRRCIRI